MGKLLPAVCALSVLIALMAIQSHDLSVRADESANDVNEELESEMELKRMLAYVTPLMAIVRKDHRIRREAEGSTDSEETGRQYYGAYSKNGYGSYSSGSSYGGGYQSCCQKKDDLLPLLALLGLAGLLLYLILIASTTTTAGGRRKRDVDDNDIDMTEGYDQGMEHK